MGLWDAIRGRARVATPNLDSLFLVPSAAITLQTAVGITPSGRGSVCFRAATGAAFRTVQDEVVALLNDDPDAPDVRLTQDEFGYTWLTTGLTSDADPADTSGLCTDLHAVNTALEGQGFGPGLLCSLVGFADGAGQRVGLVYLYKQGTFYPFAPQEAPAGGNRVRNNLLEIQVRDALADELPMETDVQRWLALWDAPGL